MTGSTVGFIGLGLMGTSMTTNLLSAGFDVRGFDLDARRRDEHVARGGHVAQSAAEVVDGIECLITSLPNGKVVGDLWFGEGGLVHHATPGLIVVDTTTSSPEDTTTTAERLAEHEVVLLDATVSGTSAMALEGNLIAMVGGPSDAYERVGPVLDGFLRARYHMGDVGSGAKTKLIVNLALNVSRVMLAEALVLGERAGMDLPTLLDVLKDSVAYSRVMDVYGDRMVEGRHEPPTGRIRSSSKDVQLISDFARSEGAPLWLTPAVAHVMQVARTMGMNEWDSTATIAVLRAIADAGAYGTTET